MQQSREYLIALGANLFSGAGSPEVTLRSAVDSLLELGAVPLAVSRFYQTPCFPPGAGPDYVNAAALLQYDGDAQKMLDILHIVETAFGRERTRRWGQRTLDLDLIAVGDTILPDIETHDAWRNLPPDQQTAQAPDRLVLPHPRLQDRGFVLVPLADVAPDWVHPRLGQTVQQMLSALPKAACAEIVALD